MSGGQLQRVAIARALACAPELVVLDEPTSSLDVLVQSRVLSLLQKLRKKRSLSFLFITHDLAVVRNIADYVAVFKEGKLVELNGVNELFSKPVHSYTKRLLSAIPVISEDEIQLLNQIKEKE
jgi:ABC-type oligopeptide transport system ATPase subunit